jgi:hypothetical protein
MPDLAAQKAEMERKLAELQRQIDDSADDETKARKAFVAKVQAKLRGRSFHATNIAEVAEIVMAVMAVQEEPDDTGDKNPPAVPVLRGGVEQ